MYIIIGICFLIAVILFIVALFKKETPHTSSENKPDFHQNRAQPGQGVMKNIKTRLQTNSDRKTQEAVNLATQTAIEGIRLSTDALSSNLEKEVLPDRHHRQLQKEQSDHFVFLSHQQTQMVNEETDRITQISKQILTRNAQEDGFTLEGHQQYLLAEKLDKISLNNKLAEMQETVRLALIAKHLSELQKINLVQELLDGIYKQIGEIQTDAKLLPETKQLMIDDRNEIIATFKAERNGRQKRLVEVNNGGNIRADDLDAEL